MLWDWLHRILYWREIREEAREMDAMARNWERMGADIDRRIASLYTPEEWAAVSERCEKKVRPL